MDATVGVFRHLAESVGLAIGIKDASGRYLWANPRFVELAQGRYREGVGDADLFPPEAAARMRELDAETLRGGTPTQDEMTLRIGDAEQVFLAERIPLVDDGRPLLAVVQTEITERSRSEKDVLASRALFRGILDIAADAIISMDESQRVVLFNQGAERIFGYTAAEVLGQPLEMLLPPASRRGHAGWVRHFAQDGGAARQMGERGRIMGCRRNGEIFPAEASISRIGLGGTVTYTAILRDVTAQKQAEAAITELNEDLSRRAAQLEAANRELEAFSYSVSHDLRAPLRGIDGFSLMLMEDYAELLPPPALNALERVRNATQRMGQLIDDMLNLSRLSRGEVNRQHVDLTAMARAVAGEMRRAHPDRVVEVEIADAMEADADPHLLQALLTNLLSNAWKYTSKHPTARVEVGPAQCPDGRAGFYVRDDGAGFDMAYVNKLFGAFQRLHGKTEYPGTGIGLAIVQRIVHKHGGEVWAEGAVEQGAKFTFALQ